MANEESSLPFDDLAAAAYYARKGEVEATQVNKLLEVLESNKRLDVLLCFLVRQVKRGPWKSKESARYLFNIIQNISKETNQINNARKALGLFKWLYEGGKGTNMSRFEPGTPVKQGFFNEYLDRCLRDE